MLSQRINSIVEPVADVNDGDDSAVEFTGVTPMMAISGGPSGIVNQPIHESLTMAALIAGNAGVAGRSLESASDADWEYIRGAVWNDDPQCLLFSKGSKTNHDYSYGAKWFMAFKQGKKEWKDRSSQKMRNPTGRSHFGDLQFLHSMASDSGELPSETKRKIMIWVEVMYKLATGQDGIGGRTKPTDTKVVEFCPDGSLPPSWETFNYYLSDNTGFEGLDAGRRALGSIFHIIQDSYAVGHTRRTPMNKEDRKTEHPLVYKPGTVDRWGAIENFHTYNGQDEHDHAHYDHPDTKLQDPNNLGNLSQFDSLIGCRMAIEKCQRLVELRNAGTKWDDGVRQFFDDEVFALAPGATPSNAEV